MPLNPAVLRVESLFVRTDRDYRKFWNTLTQIIILAWNNCLCHRNLVQNGGNTFSKMVNHFFAKKLKILYISYHAIFFQISLTCDPNTYQIIYGKTLDLQYQRQ